MKLVLLDLKHCGICPQELKITLVKRDAPWALCFDRPFYPHPFLCHTCGTVLEVTREHTADCYVNDDGDEYGSYSYYDLIDIIDHPAVVKINKSYSDEELKKDRQRWRIQDSIENKINKISEQVGGLSRQQRDHLWEKKYIKEQKLISLIENEQVELRKQFHKDIRVALGV